MPNTAKVFLVEESQRHLVPALQANLSSFALDFVARQKIGWTHMATFTVEQLPVLGPNVYEAMCSWDTSQLLSSWIAKRSLELAGTSQSLVPYLQDLGVRDGIYTWDPARRFLLRCELDAAFFHLYGLSYADADYVMDTFPIVKRNDERAHGKYRTKFEILKIHEALDEAKRAGKPYQSLLIEPRRDAHAARQARALPLPKLPAVIPQLHPATEAAIVISAFVHAAGGTITRKELALAFALRANPDLLMRFAPASVTPARDWAAKVGKRSVAPGLLAATLRELAERDAVVLGTNAESQLSVSTSPNTPAKESIDPWFHFEVLLALQVLRAQPKGAFEAIVSSLTGDDRALLEQAS